MNRAENQMTLAWTPLELSGAWTGICGGREEGCCCCWISAALEEIAFDCIFYRIFQVFILGNEDDREEEQGICLSSF